MACFVCNQFGHWASACAERVCKFCGEKGHAAKACQLQQKFKALGVDDDTSMYADVMITRTRSKKVVSKTLEDILFENHICVRPTMKADVDAFVRGGGFVKSGVVDEYAVCEYLHDRVVINAGDEGHLKVIGYMVWKYGDASNVKLKEFLRRLACEIGDAERFVAVMRWMFGLSVINKNGQMHFRKLTGFNV
jgi:hypothetical protein